MSGAKKGHVILGDASWVPAAVGAIELVFGIIIGILLGICIGLWHKAKGQWIKLRSLSVVSASMVLLYASDFTEFHGLGYLATVTLGSTAVKI